jgi:hypothetical protein
MRLADFYRKVVDNNDNFIAGWSILYYGVFTGIINQNNYKNIAEVGIGYGSHAKHVLKNTNIEKLYLIDPVTKYDNDYFSDDIMSKEAEIPGNNFNELFDLINKELSFKKEVVTFLRKPSISVRNDEIEDGALDCVFVDANHEYKNVLDDLIFWWKKIRIGGQMLGDDYGMSDVNKAVDEFAKLNNLNYDLLQKSGTDYNIFRFYKI